MPGELAILRNCARAVFSSLSKSRYAIIRSTAVANGAVKVVALSWASYYIVTKYQPTLQASWLSSSSKKMSTDDDLVKKADELYKASQFEDIYKLLQPVKDSSTNGEVLWRFARSAIDTAKASKDKELKKARIYEAMAVMERAIGIAPNVSGVHKWYAFGIKYTGEYEGTKVQIQNSYKIKEHLEKAGELNPKDATVQYALGSWAFTFADMGWVTRKVASAVFDSPPTASYQDALDYFEKAEKMEANFFSMNHLMIGKCLMALKRNDEAIPHLKRARDYEPKVLADDHEAHDEAVQLLGKLGAN